MPDPAQPGDAGDGFEPVAIVWSMPEAAVLLATLGAYGILAVPRNQGHISAAPSLMIALGGIWITVPRGQLDDTLALMSEIDTGWRCPPPPLAPTPWLNAFATLFVGFFGMTPMPRARGLYRWEPGGLRRAWPAAPSA